MRDAVYNANRPLAAVLAGWDEVAIRYMSDHLGWGRVQLIPYGDGSGSGYGDGDGYGYGDGDGDGYGDGYGYGGKET